MGAIAELRDWPTETFHRSQQYSEDKVRSLLPPSLREMEWEQASRRLHDLHRILQGVNSEGLENALENVIRISEMVEAELLTHFQALLIQLLASPSHVSTLLKEGNVLLRIVHHP